MKTVFKWNEEEFFLIFMPTKRKRQQTIYIVVVNKHSTELYEI